MRREVNHPTAMASSKILIVFALFALCALFSVSDAQYYSPYYSAYGYGYPYASYGYGLEYYGGAYGVYGKREAGFGPTTAN